MIMQLIIDLIGISCIMHSDLVVFTNQEKSVNVRRYVVCGVVSVALHSLALSAQQPPPPQFAISDAHAGSRVAIQLVAAHLPPPEPIAEKSTDETTEKVTEPKTEKSPREKHAIEENPRIEKPKM